MAHKRSKSKQEVKRLNVAELTAKAKELKDHLFQLRMQWKTGQLASTALMALARKEMARVQTALQQQTKEVKETVK